MNCTHIISLFSKDTCYTVPKLENSIKKMYGPVLTDTVFLSALITVKSRNVSGYEAAFDSGI